jgi:PilZ domain
LTERRVAIMDDSLGSPTGPGTPYRERRAAPRYSLIATVEIVEPVSDVHISGRISEISRTGCYVDILNPLPTGTLIRLRISRDQGTVSTAGKIIYIHEGMGMGVAFIEPPADQLKILDSWLAEFTS